MKNKELRLYEALSENNWLLRENCLLRENKSLCEENVTLKNSLAALEKEMELLASSPFYGLMDEESHQILSTQSSAEAGQERILSEILGDMALVEAVADDEDRKKDERIRVDNVSNTAEIEKHFRLMKVRLDKFIENNDNPKDARKNARTLRKSLGNILAGMIVDDILIIVQGEGIPVLEDITKATKKAEAALKEINDIKNALDLVASLLAFFAALRSKSNIISNWKKLQDNIKKYKDGDPMPT